MVQLEQLMLLLKVGDIWLNAMRKADATNCCRQDMVQIYK